MSDDFNDTTDMPDDSGIQLPDDVESLDELETEDEVMTGQDDADEPDNLPVDIDEQMQKTFGNVPSAGEPFTLAEEVEEDEEERHGI